MGNNNGKSMHPDNQTNYSTTTETTTSTTQSNNKPIQSMQHNTLLLSLDTWDGEKSLHYWFSIVLIQGVFELPLCDLKQCTLVCKSISKLVRDYIQRNFWFQQHNTYDEKMPESYDPEKRYLWYAPHNFKNVKNVSTLPINTTKIQFFPLFNSPLIFPIHLQHITHIIFRYIFNQPIGCGIKSEINNLPLTLTHLEFKSFLTTLEISEFTQSLDDLPPKLTHLKVNGRFSRPIENLPPNLTKLSLGYEFNNFLDKLPQHLTHLKLSELFNHPVNKLPISLTHLTFTTGYQVFFDQPLDQLQKHFESNLEYLTVSTFFLKRYESSIPPNFIRHSEYIKNLRGFYHTYIVLKKQQQQ